MENSHFRNTLWTGRYLQMTLMYIEPGESVGLERHPRTDQFLRVEEGQALVVMGDDPHHLNFKQVASEGFAIFVPAGMWHNIVNIGKEPIRLYSVYAPPEHPHGTIHHTKAIAEKMEPHPPIR